MNVNSKNTSDKLIGSLALLKAGFLEQDFISTYIPFVSTVLFKYNESINIDTIISSFTEEFGFTIERAPMTTLLNKCGKLGILNKEKNATYTINKETCSKNKIDINELKLQKEKYSIIIQKLVTYYFEKFNIIISQEDAETKLLVFLNENSCKTLIVQFNTLESDLQTQKQHQYIISSFIKNCNSEDYKTYLLIRDLATAYLMSSAIAYNEKDELEAENSFKNLIIYLDTPFVLRVLGLNDKSMQDAAITMMKQLSSIGATYRIFAHNYDELILIIEDCLRWIENENYEDCHASIALRTFIAKKYTKFEVQTYIDTLTSELKKYKIFIDDEDYYAGKYYKNQIDEAEIKRNIITVYKNYNPTFNENEKSGTVDFDVISIASIFKLWGNKTARTYSQAKYIFLTTNNTLAYIARKYLIKNNRNSVYKIYPCITDVFLGTNIWLNAPIDKVDEFSQKKLLADCMALQRPSDQLIMALQRSIERCLEDASISTSQYYLLKTKAFENNFLMNRTLSDENYFSDKITEELLQDIESNITAPYKKEIEDLQSDLKKTQSDKEIYENEFKKMEEKKESNALNDKKLKVQARKNIDNFTNIFLGLILIPFISLIVSLSPYLPFSKKYTNYILWISCFLTIVMLFIMVILKLNVFKLRNYLVYRKYVKLKIREYKQLKL